MLFDRASKKHETTLNSQMGFPRTSPQKDREAGPPALNEIGLRVRTCGRVGCTVPSNNLSFLGEGLGPRILGYQSLRPFYTSDLGSSPDASLNMAVKKSP